MSVNRAQKPRYAVTTGSYTNSTLTLSDVTGLLFRVAAGETVYFEVTFWGFSAATTTGIGIAFTGPASPTYLRYNYYNIGSGQVFLSKDPSCATSFGTSIVGASTLRTGAPGSLNVVQGTLVNGTTAGIVQMQGVSEINTSQVTIEQGAVLKWWRLT